MITKILKRQKANLAAMRTNWQGKSLKERYLIIESDDWGAVRTPSKKSLYYFKQEGINLESSAYKNDALASESDLDLLFNLLSDFRDVNGNPLCFTANTIVANPDFKKIAESRFQVYHYEDFRKTFKRYPAHSNNWRKWSYAIKEGLFKPQFHGREHLQIERWLIALREDLDKTRFCFTHGSTYSGKEDYSFMEAFDWNHPKEVIAHKAIIKDGLNIFQNAFGFEAKSFIAPCYNWDSKLTPFLKEAGIEVIQSLRHQLAPTGVFNRYVPIPHYFGEEHSGGIFYNIRNCFLEPSLNPHKDWVDSCLAQISNAFSFKKPAVICSHRINYIGFIKEKNRDRGLYDLRRLIQTVLKRWPDVQFISTDQLTQKLK